MPLSEKGERILDKMRDTYKSDEKAKSVFYASANKGTITGVHESRLPNSGVTKNQLESFHSRLHRVAKIMDD